MWARSNYRRLGKVWHLKYDLAHFKLERKIVAGIGFKTGRNFRCGLNRSGSRNGRSRLAILGSLVCRGGLAAVLLSGCLRLLVSLARLAVLLALSAILLLAIRALVVRTAAEECGKPKTCLTNLNKQGYDKTGRDRKIFMI